MIKTNNVIVVYTPYWKNAEANTEVEQYKIEKLAATEKEEEEQEKEIAKIIVDMNDRRVTEKEELQQYRAIGTVEELKTMKEHGGFSGIELAEIAAAIKTLKEYEQIGTLEECRAAMQEQTEKEWNFKRERVSREDDKWFTMINSIIVRARHERMEQNNDAVTESEDLEARR